MLTAGDSMVTNVNMVTAKVPCSLGILLMAWVQVSNCSLKEKNLIYFTYPIGKMAKRSEL